MRLEARPAPQGEELNLADLEALLKRERFHDALAAFSRLPRQVGDEPRARLLKAILLLQAGDAVAAATVAADLLGDGDVPAGAHVALALCLEGHGQPGKVTEHLLAAIRADSSFAIPYLHLGRHARQAGRLAEAVRRFRQALLLLPDESEGRLLLFGGGLSREALLAMCRSELSVCEATP